jgi:hypothetical protein
MASGWTVVYEIDVGAPRLGSAAGKSLLYYHHQIDELARQLGLVPLSAFFSRDPGDILRYMREMGVEPDPANLPDEEWFEPTEGLATVRGLLVHLQTHTTDLPEPARIVADLQLVEQSLLLAIDHGVRFHLGRQLEIPERE